MSTDWLAEVDPDVGSESEIEVFEATGFGPPSHAAEADLFARHEGVPGHLQSALEQARVLLVGGGGLGSWVALGLARSGVRMVTIVEHDRFDRTNAPRQLMFEDDLRRPKAFGLAKNVVPHMIAGGRIIAVRLPFADAAERYALNADVVVGLVDNNEARHQMVRYARNARIPCVFGMLSADSLRMHTFLQSADNGEPCLWCALPNLAVNSHAPCASATVASCFLAGAHVTFFVYRALMGWPDGAERFNWREVDLLGQSPDHVSRVSKRKGCPVCPSVLAP